MKPFSSSNIKTSQLARVQNCPDITILIIFLVKIRVRVLWVVMVVRVVGVVRVVRVVGWSCGRVAGFVRVVRVARSRVILSEIPKWQRFLEVISRFLEVVSWFLEVISTKGRYRAARAAKKAFRAHNLVFCLRLQHHIRAIVKVG